MLTVASTAAARMKAMGLSALTAQGWATALDPIRALPVILAGLDVEAGRTARASILESWDQLLISTTQVLGVLRLTRQLW